MLAAEAMAQDNHKVRSGEVALAALHCSAGESSHSDRSSVMTSPLAEPPADLKSMVWPPSTPPVDISSLPARQSPTRSGSSGRKSFLSCFSAGATQTMGDDDTPSTCECEVGIRPSFYWVDGPTTEAERAEAEVSFRFLKADCQDEATTIQNFAGIPGLTFVGVFDGHGPNGRAAAKFASERVPAALAAQISALRSRSERKRLKAMRDACHQVDAAMRDIRLVKFDASMSGTTACFALVVTGPRSHRVLIANVGDSRCVLARRRPDGAVEAIPLTEDAKPSLEKEAQRIRACGGVVRQMLDEGGKPRGAHRVFCRGDDVLPGLAMSRSLGDTYAHAVGVTWEPMLSAHSLTGRDLFLVLGTDGVWDVMSNDATVDFVDRYRCRRDPGVSCAEALTLEAQERWKAAHDEALVDDISVAILHVAPMPPVGLPPNPARGMSSKLSRAASCNDEANAMSSNWRGVAVDENPSHRSPRSFFQHLYRTGDATGSGEFWDSLNASRGDSLMMLPYRQAANNGASTPPSSPKPNAAAPSPAAVAAPAVATPEPHSPGSPLQVSAFSVAAHHPIPEEGEEGDLMGRRPSQGFAGSRASSGIPIPASRTHSGSMAASAPAAPSAGMMGCDYLRPIRKAYPSTTTFPSVPSWDGAFVSSYRSNESLHGMAETPRSTESEVSGGGPERGRRREMRHEGKVRRGIPMSLSSAGLVSSCRLSVDSDRAPSAGGDSCREDSLGDGGLLAGSLGHHGGLGALGYSRSLPLPRSSSHGNLIGAQHRTHRVTLVRDIHTAIAAASFERQ